MKNARKKAIILIAAGALLGLPALAQEAPGQDPAAGSGGGTIAQKIGFLNYRDALQATNEVQAEIATIQTYIDQKNQESNRRAEEVAALQDEIANKGLTLNAQALSDLQTQLEEKQTDLKRFREDTQREIDRRRNQLFRTYGPKMQEVIDEYAQANGFSAIFLLDQQQYGYIKPELILTAQIAELYNQKHPGSGAPQNPGGGR